MKRFHIHVAVANLAHGIEFYSQLFGQSPITERDDYAKWMLEDPRINFAISARGHAVGVNHLGIQADTPDELQTLKQFATAASNGGVLASGRTECCYATSDKHWTLDPAGLAWEHFHTLSETLEYGGDTASPTGACCIPPGNSEQIDVQATRDGCTLRATTD